MQAIISGFSIILNPTSGGKIEIKFIAVNVENFEISKEINNFKFLTNYKKNIVCNLNSMIIN